MDKVILDLGDDVNVLRKQTWECMGRPTLQWSLIQLQLANQQKILPLGRLPGVVVDINGPHTHTDFEVIEIMDDNSPYLELRGIYWEIDMNGIINLKKKKIIFKKNALRVVIPLDLAKGARYTEPVHDNDSDRELDCIYQLTTWNGDRMNPTTDGRLSWDHDSSCTSDSDEEVERWKNRLHEVTTLNCNRMVVVGVFVSFAKVTREPVVSMKSKLDAPKVFTSQKSRTLTKEVGVAKHKLKHGGHRNVVIPVAGQTRKNNP